MGWLRLRQDEVDSERKIIIAEMKMEGVTNFN